LKGLLKKKKRRAVYSYEDSNRPDATRLKDGKKIGIPSGKGPAGERSPSGLKGKTPLKKVISSSKGDNCNQNEIS